MVMSSNIAWKKAHVIFVFNATATSEIYTLSLHDALPIYQRAQLLAALPAQPFGKDPDMGIVADTVRAAAVADNVVVEVGDDLPALRPGMFGEDAAADQALFLARQSGVDDGGGEAIARQDPRRLDHRRGAGAVVIGAGRIGGGVHRVADPAVDVAGDDHHLLRPHGAALDGDDILDQGRG